MSSLYAPVNDKIISKLSFSYSACNYVYFSNSKGTQLGTLYSTDENTFLKIKNILQGDEAVQVKKGDKVFILPGHPLTQNRIQDYLKNIGANTTKNLSSATVIAGCEDLYEEVWQHDTQAKPSSLLIKCDEIYKIVDSGHNTLDNTFWRLFNDDTIITKLIDDHDENVDIICSNKIHCKVGFNQNIDMVKDYHLITPDCMSVMYYILSKGLKVLSADTIAEKANSGLKLEEESTYLSIYQMLDSADNKNIKLGVDILVHCDLTGDSLYNIWRLATKFRNVLRYDHNKGASYFKTKTQWSNLMNMDHSNFITYAEEEEKLTPRIVKELMPTVFNNMVDKSPVNVMPESEWDEDDFFECIDNGDMSYTIQLKEKWKSMLKEETDEDN